MAQMRPDQMAKRRASLIKTQEKSSEEGKEDVHKTPTKSKRGLKLDTSDVADEGVTFSPKLYGKEFASKTGFCCIEECGARIFADRYCAVHLPSRDMVMTPTTLSRQTFALWEHNVSVSDKSGIALVSWKFIWGGKSHEVEIKDNLKEGQYTISLDSELVHQSKVEQEMYSWEHKFVLGKPGGEEKMVVLVASKNQDTYGLLLNGKSWRSLKATFEGRILRDQAKQLTTTMTAAEKERQQKYVKDNWSSKVDEEGTKKGFTKSIATWNFTIRGEKHEVKLFHSHMSGKRKVEVDGEVKAQQTPGLLSPGKNYFDLALGSSQLTVELKPRKKSDSFPHGWEYDLRIDNVSFDAAQHSVFDVIEQGGLKNATQKAKSQRRSQLALATQKRDSTQRRASWFGGARNSSQRPPEGHASNSSEPRGSKETYARLSSQE